MSETATKHIALAELYHLIYNYGWRILQVDSDDLLTTFVVRETTGAIQYWGHFGYRVCQPITPGDMPDPPELPLYLVAEFYLSNVPNEVLADTKELIVTDDNGVTRRFVATVSTYDYTDRVHRSYRFEMRPDTTQSDGKTDDWVAAAMKTFTVAQMREMENKGRIEETFTDCRPSLVDWCCHFGGILKHKFWVAWYLTKISAKLMWRAFRHDWSKFRPSEARAFAFTTRRLRKVTYLSHEYEYLTDLIKPTIRLHYSRNPHHPDHYGNKPEGIHKMSHIDMIEMLCDWRAAARRHDDGDPVRSVEVNKGRFGYGDELEQLFLKFIQD